MSSRKTLDRLSVQFLKKEGVISLFFYVLQHIFAIFFAIRLHMSKKCSTFALEIGKRMYNTSSGETEGATLGSDLGGIAG